MYLRTINILRTIMVLHINQPIQIAEGYMVLEYTFLTLGR